MGNPHEYRELVKAAFGYSDKTTEQVIAEQEARRNKESSGSSQPSAKRGRPTAPSHGVAKQSELDKLAKILAMSKPRQPPGDE